MARYLIIDIAYYPRWLCDGPDDEETAEWEPTPDWFGDSFPDLRITDDSDAGEEYSEFPDIATRKFVGIITERDWETLADDWNMREEDSEPNLGMLCEYGWLPSDSWTHDGMDWNAGGMTPIAFIDVRVSPRYTFA